MSPSRCPTVPALRPLGQWDSGHLRGALAACRGPVVRARRWSPAGLSRRPLDDLHQNLLAFLDAEMAIVPIELVASGVEITDRACPLEVDLDALTHFLE